ncbi:MAG: iron-containing redox enzyme family protein [Ilumatobacter sp.]|uniref:iron-containing redox enzyme family protein n=1 Tax=Ilumatobacter sp. TaxID=1967498 RepID=UPI0032990C15
MTSRLPTPVGPVSDHIIDSLRRDAAPSTGVTPSHEGDPLDHDLHLGLYVLNELHYSGWDDVSDGLECDRDVAALRSELNDLFERSLRHALPGVHSDPREEVHRLLGLGGPSVSRHLRDVGTIEQVRESMILRTPYQSKEADPHTFAMPRFSGATKRVFTEIQSGEYGVGHRRSHAELFADALEGLGLDATPNAHIDACDGAALATSNLVTLGAMQRRLRGIVLGQLSLFEMDSVVPNQAMVDCCDRLELDASVRPFFHIHVMADTEHEQMVESAFLTDYPLIEPDQVDNMLLGMRAQSLIDHTIAAHAVPRWLRHRSALGDGAPERLAS